MTGPHLRYCLPMLYKFLCILWLSVVVGGTSCHAQQEEKSSDSNSKLPVKQVVLFTSGVGYYQHQAEIDGEATVDLKFNVDEINDLLKSMVLQDLGGGQISTVTYGSRDPLSKTLSTFAIDLTQNPTLGQLLGQVRGASVVVDAPTSMEGKIVGTEKQEIILDEGQTVEIEYLNLLTEQGLRRVALDSVGRIQLADEQLDAELRQALSLLAMEQSSDKKSVTLKFLGEGEREVRVGYIQEAPVWKTSYRLVLDEEEKPFLQGWAIVENTTENDWEDVNLRLVSGRPISFVMDLYSPLYTKRPEVQMELYSSLTPQVYEQSLEGDASARRPASASPGAESSVARGRGGGRRSLSFGAPVQNLDRFRETVQAAATGGDVGELFEYEIESPVSLDRQRSAMLPIINQEVEGEKLSIYNPRVQTKHPLNGFRLKNTSDLHLMQGPITVFDDGIYAGDAQIADLSPGSERLLSYALDLNVEVAPESESEPRSLASVKIQNGMLEATFKQVRTLEYILKNSSDQAKTVLIEHRINNDYELLEPEEPTEKTREHYRFAVETEANETTDFTIKTERILHQQISLFDFSTERIGFDLSAEEISDEVREALEEIQRQQQEIAELKRQKADLEQENQTIREEQERIRQNMRSIDRNTELYNRYVKKFDEQEDRIEQLREEQRELEEQIAEAEQSLREYIEGLEIE